MKVIKILLSMLLIFVLLEVFTYAQNSYKMIKKGYEFSNNSKIPSYPTNIKTFQEYYTHLFRNFNYKKSLIGKKYKNAPIIVFGDVFAHGTHQKNNMTRIISDSLQSPVYDFARPGWGIQHMYFMLTKDKRLLSINPQTIIFVYNKDQRNRLTSYSFYLHHPFLNLRYKLENDKLVLAEPRFMFLYSSYFVRNLERIHGWRVASSKDIKQHQELNELIKQLFIQSKKVAEKNYSNLKKFIIFRITIEKDSLQELEDFGKYTQFAKNEYDMWQELKKNGFTIVDLSQCTKVDKTIKRYRLPDSSLDYNFMEKFMPKFFALAQLKPESIKIATVKKVNDEDYPTEVKETKTAKEVKDINKAAKDTPLTNKTEKTTKPVAKVAKTTQEATPAAKPFNKVTKVALQTNKTAKNVKAAPQATTATKPVAKTAKATTQPTAKTVSKVAKAVPQTNITAKAAPKTTVATKPVAKVAKATTQPTAQTKTITQPVKTAQTEKMPVKEGITKVCSTENTDKNNDNDVVIPEKIAVVTDTSETETLKISSEENESSDLTEDTIKDEQTVKTSKFSKIKFWRKNKTVEQTEKKQKTEKVRFKWIKKIFHREKKNIEEENLNTEN